MFLFNAILLPVKAETKTNVILLQVRTVLQKTNERLSFEVTPFPKDIISLGDQTAKKYGDYASSAIFYVPFFKSCQKSC